MYGAAKLKQRDQLPNNTACIQVMANKIMKLIKPGGSPVREWGTANICLNFNSLSINQMVVKFKSLEYGNA